MGKMRAWTAAAAVAVAGGLLGAFELASCAGEPSIDELSKQTVIITQFAPGTDFTAFKTFAIADSIQVVREVEAGQSLSVPLDPAIATPTLDAVAAELTSRGYTKVDRSAAPDLGVAVTAVIRLNAAAFYGAWWGFGPTTPGFWGYPTAAFSTAITSAGLALWRSGAFVIELYDLRAARQAAAAQTAPKSVHVLAAELDGGADAGPGTPIPVVWGAIIYGFLKGLTEPLPGPPIDGVRQAFAQSPYLRSS